MSQSINCYFKAPWDCVEQEHGIWNYPRDLTIKPIINITNFLFQQINHQLDWFNVKIEAQDVLLLITPMLKKIQNKLKVVMPGAVILK